MNLDFKGEQQNSSGKTQTLNLVRSSLFATIAGTRYQNSCGNNFLAVVPGFILGPGSAAKGYAMNTLERRPRRHFKPAVHCGFTSMGLPQIGSMLPFSPYPGPVKSETRFGFAFLGASAGLIMAGW